MSITITVTGEHFLTNGVKIGDTVVPLTVNGHAVDPTHYLLKNGAAALDYDTLQVCEVLGEDSFKMEAYKNGTAIPLVEATHLNLAPTQSFTFDIVHTNTKDEQVEEVCAIARGYNNKRVVLVWPPKAEYIVDGQVVTVDGSALAASLAAAKSIYAPQQSMTNVPFTGPNKLYYSNNYFTPAQLNKLSDAGVLVLVQDAPGAGVYARHQKTTSNVSIQEEEMSITNAIDKFSIDMASIAKPFLGKYNITQDLLTQLHDVYSTYLFNAKSNKAPYCGSLIVDFSNLALRANLEGLNTDLPPGKLEIALTIEVGYPANYINIKIYVQ
jgi:hypothetical protein